VNFSSRLNPRHLGRCDGDISVFFDKLIFFSSFFFYGTVKFIKNTEARRERMKAEGNFFAQEEQKP